MNTHPANEVPPTGLSGAGGSVPTFMPVRGMIESAAGTGTYVETEVARELQREGFRLRRALEHAWNLIEIMYHDEATDERREWSIDQWADEYPTSIGPIRDALRGSNAQGVGRRDGASPAPASPESETR